jgi:hypothetical protein
MLPPPEEPTQVRRVPSASRTSIVDNELWTVKLELGDEEIAKLYGQGMARGAVVWRKGMVEWRPLLITPEFKNILRRTRITVPPPAPPVAPPMPAFSAPPEELTVPRPARLPESITPVEYAPSPFSTMAPMAADIEMPPPRTRRPMELAAVAIGAFALAWIGHATLSGGDSGEATRLSAAAGVTTAPASTPPMCEPTTSSASSTSSEKPGIRTVSVADLPLAGNRADSSASTHAAAATTPAHASASRAARSTPAVAAPAPAPAAPMATPVSPSRSDLVSAMSGVARASSGCGERGGPVRVVVTFANSGVARSIQVSGSDLPAATRSCIIGAASRARVSAFTGDPVTVSKAL